MAISTPPSELLKSQHNDQKVEEVKEENQRLSVAMKKLKEKQGDKESNIEVNDQKRDEW